MYQVITDEKLKETILLKSYAYVIMYMQGVI